ncbi:transposase [Streptomyces sp. NPDC087226]|jgi:hypothetical protein|uniref:transposase n=1 Tax=Streptomyces sp. NPDC087226 TaxID=3365771 RepID=UPI00381BDA7A
MIQSTNPLERLNRESKRRTDVVQVLPTGRRPPPRDRDPAELHDEWIALPRRHLPNESMDVLYTDTPTVLPAASDD